MGKKFIWSAIFLFFSTGLAFGGFNLKNVAVLGDSQTWIGGDSCQNPIGWTHHFLNLANPESISIYARSGATFTNNHFTMINPDYYTEYLDDDNVIYNQVVRLIRDIDSDSVPSPSLVILYAGANDAWFQDARKESLFPPHSSLKTINPSDPPSAHRNIAESIALAVAMIREKCPDAGLLLVTPAEMAKTSVENVRFISHLISQTGEMLNIPVVRLDIVSPIRHHTESISPKFTSDGVHTNEVGAEVIARIIYDFIKNYN